MPEEVSVETPNVSEEVLSPNTVETPETPVEPKVFDEAYVKSVREEAARNRVEKQQARSELEELRARVKEYEDANLSSQEKMARDFDEAQTKAMSLEQRAIEAELKFQLAMAARDENISDVKAAVKLADRGLIEYGNDGSIENMSDVISSLRLEYPSLFNPTFRAPNTGVTNPAKSTSPKKYTREDLKTMSNERRVELLESGELKHLL